MTGIPFLRGFPESKREKKKSLNKPDGCDFRVESCVLLHSVLFMGYYLSQYPMGRYLSQLSNLSSGVPGCIDGVFQLADDPP